MPSSTAAEILSVQQAAAELNISPRAVIHRIKAGSLAGEKLGGGKTSAYVITRAEVERSLREAQEAAS